jgi:hypothetical protein
LEYGIGSFHGLVIIGCQLCIRVNDFFETNMDSGVKSFSIISSRRSCANIGLPSCATKLEFQFFIFIMCPTNYQVRYTVPPICILL